MIDAHKYNSSQSYWLDVWLRTRSLMICQQLNISKEINCWSQVKKQLKITEKNYWELLRAFNDSSRNKCEVWTHFTFSVPFLSILASSLWRTRHAPSGSTEKKLTSLFEAALKCFEANLKLWNPLQSHGVNPAGLWEKIRHSLRCRRCRWR